MIETPQQRRIVDNWRQVVQDVSEAASKHDRDPEAVRIIAVTKYVDTETTAIVARAGCRDLAESRPQQLWKKAEDPDFPEGVNWHLIGHLQRNKVRRTLRHCQLIHSVDSSRLLQAIEEQARSGEQQVSILLEVNASGEDAKTGLPPGEIAAIIEQHRSEYVRLIGLMAMAGWGTNPEQARQQFAAVRELRDDLQQRSGMELPELSMGMSGDFREAIAEGSTMVRIGTRLFEGVLSD